MSEEAGFVITRIGSNGDGTHAMQTFEGKLVEGHPSPGQLLKESSFRTTFVFPRRKHVPEFRRNEWLAKAIEKRGVPSLKLQSYLMDKALRAFFADPSLQFPGFVIDELCLGKTLEEISETLKCGIDQVITYRNLGLFSIARRLEKVSLSP